jgi:thiosulfate/3-mercaptopyruvate sulfurtransferase
LQADIFKGIELLFDLMYTTLIQAQELHDHINDPDWVIVDCRYELSDGRAGHESYLDSHIPNAVYADLHTDLSDLGKAGRGRHPLPDPRALQRLFVTLGIHHDSQVVVYDAASGSIAARLWWLLKFMHHGTVAVLDGGWQTWLAAGYATESGAGKNPPGSFSGKPREEMLVNREQLPACPLLVDSRDPARYRGEFEPLDPVAGHVPGALNHYWKDNLEEAGCFRTPHQIRYDFTQLFNGIAPEQVVFYCGSGVTACLNLVAAQYAGLPLPRLYAGSWSEWCTGENPAVETGCTKE